MKLYTKRLFMLLTTLLLIFSVTPLRAETSTETNTEKNIQSFYNASGELVTEGEVMECIESKGGTFVVETNDNNESNSIYNSKDTDSAIVNFKLLRSTNIDNVYEIMLEIISTDLVKAVRGDVEITNTSLLSPKTFFEKSFYHKFDVASTVNYAMVPLHMRGCLR